MLEYVTSRTLTRETAEIMKVGLIVFLEIFGRISYSLHWWLNVKFVLYQYHCTLSAALLMAMWAHGGGRWMQGIEIARKGKCKERLPKFATLWICKEWNLQGKDFVRNAYPVAYWRTKFLFCVYQFRWHQYLAYCTVYIMWEWLYSVLNM